MVHVPCPFVYANSKQCAGRIVRVEAYKADVTWEEGQEGKWKLTWSPRSHYHLFCSERGNHAGYKKQDDGRMKFYGDQLPDQVGELLARTVVLAAASVAPDTMT